VIAETKKPPAGGFFVRRAVRRKLDQGSVKQFD
jgi:hypothetical protein